MVDVVVFDVGGVLVKLGSISKFVSWTGLEPDQVKDRWLRSKGVRAFETGRLSYESFAKSILSEFSIPLGIRELETEMAGWLGELYPYAEAILADVGRRYQLACLSNLNPIQWPKIRDHMGLGKWFKHQFVSCEIGLLKPDRAVYEHVSRVLQVVPENIVFFDDNQANVDGALQAGWSAHRVQGTHELKLKLSELGLSAV
jgi:FMN phosphatase YigB (HAD superfamily)